MDRLLGKFVQLITSLQIKMKIDNLIWEGMAVALSYYIWLALSIYS